MTYEEVLEKINCRLRFGMKPGLERIRKLLAGLGNPQDRLKFVHVAGTNGKGTCSTLISSVLIECGVKTGLYISPYVLEFRERFQINGELISKEELVSVYETVQAVAEEMEAAGETVTEFEMITAMALLWFYEKGCGAVVLEVGLGGRFDATNVIRKPEAAVIMSISLDHTAILGDTVSQIAFEKAGIIKEGSDVILYPVQETEALSTISKVCRERNARLFIPEIEDLEIVSAGIEGTAFRAGGVELFTPFLGGHQVLNALTAYQALCVLKTKGFPVSDERIRRGFGRARIPARMEILSKEPLVLLDGGHNPGCAKALKEAVQSFLPGKKLAAVIGMMSDKDSRTALSILGPLFSEIVTVAPDQSRAIPAEELAVVAGEFSKHVQAASGMEDAVEKSMKMLDKDTALIVCGSFFLASEIREPIMKRLKK